MDEASTARRKSKRASALRGLRALYPGGEASYAQRLPESQRERLAPAVGCPNASASPLGEGL